MSVKFSFKTPIQCVYCYFFCSLFQKKKKSSTFGCCMPNSKWMWSNSNEMQILHILWCEEKRYGTELISVDMIMWNKIELLTSIICNYFLSKDAMSKYYLVEKQQPKPSEWSTFITHDRFMFRMWTLTRYYRVSAMFYCVSFSCVLVTVHEQEIYISISYRSI